MSIVLYDGNCALCNRAVKFVDKKAAIGDFQFIAQESIEGRKLLASKENRGYDIDSLWFIEGEKSFSKSSAVLVIANRLRFPWSIFSTIFLIPKSLRDLVYDFVARNRMVWFSAIKIE